MTKCVLNVSKLIDCTHLKNKNIQSRYLDQQIKKCKRDSPYPTVCEALEVSKPAKTQKDCSENLQVCSMKFSHVNALLTKFSIDYY